MKRATLLTMTCGFLLAACGGEEPDAVPDRPDMEPGAPAATEDTGHLPDTTAEAVWAHLQREGYTSWALWPGKGRLYSGGEPHGMLLTTYVDPTAMDALESGSGSIPVGGFVVKENYMPDSTLAAVTVMFKTESFNPEHGNWWFLKRLADGAVEASGRVQGCQDCHGGRADNDYIMTADLPLATETGEADGR